MAIDRFIRWRNERPTLAQIRATLEDYLGEALKEIHEDGPRLTAVLCGKPQFPFRRDPEVKHYTEASEQHPTRWFEVFVERHQIDVITRQTDEYTNVVAEGFAALCRRRWDGRKNAV